MHHPAHILPTKGNKPVELFGWLFGRQRQSWVSPAQCRPDDTKQQYALPLTITEAGRLADSLALVDRLSYTHPTGLPGVAYARNLANQVATYVGGAKFRGYTYVPVPVYHLPVIDNALEAALTSDSSHPDVATFEALVRRMHVLEGMAVAGGWVLNQAASGAAWLNAEPDRSALDFGDNSDLTYID